MIHSKKFREQLKQKVIEENYKFWINEGLHPYQAGLISSDLTLYNPYCNGEIDMDYILKIVWQKFLEQGDGDENN